MVRARSLVLVLLVLLGALPPLGATCGSPEECPCFPCLITAVALTVVDQDGNPLEQPWVMAATLDGEVVDDGGACDPDLRIGDTCAFGDSTGVYRIVVEAPGYQTREVAARCAAASGVDCCAGGCADETLVVARLLPE
ncbi:MAG: hypothetical protein IT383_05105 [Deltaproteobacteria bacterium]|nr:hypothetical protein [Deltaproteobacteria bacterium]